LFCAPSLDCGWGAAEFAGEADAPIAERGDMASVDRLDRHVHDTRYLQIGVAVFRSPKSIEQALDAGAGGLAAGALT